MRQLALVLVFAAATPFAFAQAPQITRIDVTDVGIYTMDVASSSVDERGISHSVWSNIRLVEQTQTIHIKMGLHFGFHFSIVGTPDGATVELREVAIYPSQGLHNPDLPNPIFRGESFMTGKIGQVDYTGAGLNRDWGLVPGNWTIELWCGSQKMASETFTLIP